MERCSNFVLKNCEIWQFNWTSLKQITHLAYEGNVYIYVYIYWQFCDFDQANPGNFYFYPWLLCPTHDY